MGFAGLLRRGAENLLLAGIKAGRASAHQWIQV
jgi:hypothetical protein